MKKLKLYLNLKKASETGTFRGGDPEELQFKKEEKLREQKESGEFEQKEVEIEEQAEQADPGEVEEQLNKENEKKEDKEAMASSISGVQKSEGSFRGGMCPEDMQQKKQEKEAELKENGEFEETDKSLGLLTNGTNNQASPVNTTDYKPADKEGNKAPYPFEFKGKKQERVEDPSVRPGKNQNKIYSEEVLGMPPKGAPTGPRYGRQKMREEDMCRRGVLPEACCKAIDILKAAYTLQGRTEFQGLKISIENKKGSERKWYDLNNKESGSTKMYCDYGYIRMTEGVDGDHVDVYLGPNENAEFAYVVHQMKAPEFKQYDEDKCMLGFNSSKEAKAAYLKQYNSPKFFGSMTEVSMDKFKEKVLATKNNSKMIKSK